MTSVRNRASKPSRDKMPPDWWPPTRDYAIGVIRSRILEAERERIRERELHIAGRVSEAEECKRAATRHREYAAEIQERFWPTGAAPEIAEPRRVVRLGVKP